MASLSRWESPLVPSGGSRRYGITSGVDANGRKVQEWKGWKLPKDGRTRYRGLYRHGDRVLFHYEIGNAKVFDMVREDKHSEGAVGLPLGLPSRPV